MQMTDDERELVICPRCNGNGYLTLWGTERTDVTCGACNGEGRANRAVFGGDGDG